MTPRSTFVFPRQRIVVADEGSISTAFLVDTLRHDGHCVSQATDGSSPMSAFELRNCHLFISGARVDGVAHIDFIVELRDRLPTLPVLYLADARWSTPELEALLPTGVAILREPFTAQELRAAVRPLLPQSRLGSILALPAATPSTSCPA